MKKIVLATALLTFVFAKALVEKKLKEINKHNFKITFPISIFSPI